MEKFKTGSLVMTKAVLERCNDDKSFATFVTNSYDRYINCDWGDTCEEDSQLNDEAVEAGDRILAAYTYPGSNDRIWIITEYDRSATTILFPWEY